MIAHAEAAAATRISRTLTHLLAALAFVLLAVWSTYPLIREMNSEKHYDLHARGWGIAAVLFGVVALGPFLHVMGLDTGLPLPDSILRYVPILSNARNPGRAVIVVQLCIAVLCALSLAGLRSQRARIAILVAMALELVPRPVPLYAIPPPDSIDLQLATDPFPGAVVELPTGLRDGFGESGRFDHRALVRQMTHGRPLVGGFVARLSPRVSDSYAQSVLLSSLLDLSEPGEDATLPDDAAKLARTAGIGFVVVNGDAMPRPRDDIQWTLEHAGFRLVRRDGSRDLYSSAAP